MSTSALRWFAKKSLRATVAAISPRLATRDPGGISRLRVLTFHRFARRSRDPFAVDPDQFARQMEVLASRGVAVGLDAVERVLDGGVCPPDAVLVTIDDGCASTLEVAAPILGRFGVPAVAFVTAGRLGHDAGDHPERFLTRDEVAALPSFGIEVGSHGWTHQSLAGADDAMLRRQLDFSRDCLGQVMGRGIRAFAYPYGTRADYSARTRSAVRDAGYQACFTSQHGAITPGADRFELPRIKIEGGEGARMFDAACRGGLDAWSLVDRYAAAWQASGR